MNSAIFVRLAATATAGLATETTETGDTSHVYCILSEVSAIELVYYYVCKLLRVYRKEGVPWDRPWLYLCGNK